MERVMRVLGFMSGTSLDGIDMAVVETDGVSVSAFGPAGEGALPEETRALVLDAIAAGRRWGRGEPEPNLFGHVAEAVTRAHFDAAEVFLAKHGLGWGDIDLIGFHGQTVAHEAPTPERPGRTRQLGDGEALARLTGVPVAFDFRTVDVEAGGQGAPLVPIYHAALVQASGLKPPVAVLNLGGVGNLTLIGADGSLRAFDTGPGNGLIDAWVEANGAGRYDTDARLALAGRVHEGVVAAMMDHPFFGLDGPKSLDRYDFTPAPVRGLSLQDGAATLAAFTAAAVAWGLKRAGFAAPCLIVCGGGRRNPAILRELGLRARTPVMVAEAVGWRGDSIEAEAFAYLAARTAAGLQITFPGTTGAASAMTGGRLARP